MLNPISQPGKLTDLDKFLFESWGYIIIPNVLTKEEVKECLEASTRLHENSPGQWAQIGSAFEKEPIFERLIDHPATFPKVRGLYGDRFILQSVWSTKQPGRGGNGHWHQDGSSAFPFVKLGHPIPLLQLRVSYLLTDQSEPGTGNMEMIPGSHRSHVPVPEGIKQERADVPIGHVICAPPGSALIFHNAVWHRTYEHNHDYDRHTVHYIYSPPWLRWSDRFQNSKAFLESTTPVRRYLMGEFDRPDAPFGAPYEAYNFEDDD